MFIISIPSYIYDVYNLVKKLCCVPLKTENTTTQMPIYTEAGEASATMKNLYYCYISFVTSEFKEKVG